MEIKKHVSVKEALKSVLTKDQEYIFVRHDFFKGESVKRHFHPKANEWIVIDNGRFEVRADDEREVLNLKNEPTSIKFMVSQKHSISALSDISYFVVRDREDKVVYSNNLF